MTFVEILRTAVAEKPAEKSDFVRSLAAGAYPREALSIYAVRLRGLVSMFPRRLAAIASICPEREARIALLENLLEEEGALSFEPVRGITADERLAHTCLIRRFSEASGDDSSSVTDGAIDESWFDEQIAGRNFLAASAYLNLGIEGAAPATFAHVTPALRTVYGFSEKEVAFFSEHMTADERHCRRAADTLERLARTEADRAEVVRGIRRGVLTWSVFHRNVHRAMTAAGRPSPVAV